MRFLVSLVLTSTLRLACSPAIAQTQHGYTRHTPQAITDLKPSKVCRLDLLRAFLLAVGMREAYEDALQQRYFWYEFGDSNLII
jgi:S-adenosylmethionine:tRNA-ribosyltransferase-isomerase (queuine synthetase)